MKIFFLALTMISSLSLSAGTHITREYSLSSLLSLYYDVKDALINSDATAASKKAAALLEAINGIDVKSLPKSERDVFAPLQTKLSDDAIYISKTKDVNKQREHFASLSLNMFTLAKNAKLSDQPVYKDYCPMKKAYWLSNVEAIKNPYYGNTMLTCGKVDETIQ